MKKNNKTLYGLILVTIAILFMFATLQSGFAADVPIDNTTTGGINGAITNSTTIPGDTIILNPGNYTGTNNTGIIINKNLTIRGNGPTDSVIINAESVRRIFTINANLTVTFINITFINGGGTNGAITTTATTMNFINCTFTGNQRFSIFTSQNEHSDNLVTITNSTFIDNIGVFSI